MKYLIGFLSWVAMFVVTFLLLSLFGFFWGHSYQSVISDKLWFLWAVFLYIVGTMFVIFTDDES